MTLIVEQSRLVLLFSSLNSRILKLWWNEKMKYWTKLTMMRRIPRSGTFRYDLLFQAPYQGISKTTRCGLFVVDIKLIYILKCCLKTKYQATTDRWREVQLSIFIKIVHVWSGYMQSIASLSLVSNCIPYRMRLCEN